MNYLQIVNSAIIESGATLEELTSSTFPTTTDPLHIRFKRWAAQALKEEEMEREDWEYKSKQAQVVIYPRFLCIDGDRATAPPANSTYTGDDSEAQFTVVSTDLISGTWAGGDAEANIDFVNLSLAPAWNELFDEDDPTPANLNVFRLKWWGRYNFQSEINGLREINYSSFSIQAPSGLADTTLNQGAADNVPLTWIPWDQFNIQFETTQQWGRPAYVTRTPDNEFDFYPRPNGPYVLTFNYTADPQTLTLYSDEIADLPALYQDAIVWRTVMYWADYDRKPDQFQRAERRYMFYKSKAEKNLMPTPSFGLNRYDMPNANW